MKNLSNESPQLLEKDILDLIEDIAKKNKVKLTGEGSYIRKFTKLIEEISNKNMVNGNKDNVVVLIDEYDAPILDHINNTILADANRIILQNFYNVLKESEKHLRFVFITGITKFTKTSIFSKFNNFIELSLHKDYSTICGITHNELKSYYENPMQEMAKELNHSYEEILNKFNYWYDGYSFDGVSKVFNPFSTLNALYERRFISFWFSSGTPGFLAEIFKHKEFIGDYTKPKELKYSQLNAIDPENINETTLLFQSGYLTIEKEFIEDDEIYYSLKIPNFEVEQAYKDNLINLYVNEFKDKYTNLRTKLWDDINNYKCDNLANRLQDDINISPSYLNMKDKENWKIYESLFLMWMNIMGFDVTGEKLIKHGRIDGVFKDYDNNHVIICEVKYTQNSSKPLSKLIEEVLTHLKDRRYWMGYTTRKKSLMAIVFKDEIIYDDKTMTIVKCKIENFNPEEIFT